MKYILISIVFWTVSMTTTAWIIEFEQNNYTVLMNDEANLLFNLTSDSIFTGDVSLEVLSEDKDVIVFDKNFTPKLNINISVNNGEAQNFIPVKAIFLGQTRLILTITQTEDGHSEELQPLSIKVIRKKRTIDKIFTGSVATLVALIYINFGCAFNWSSVKSILRRPIGPAIGFFGQFAVMPTLAYIIGILVFPDRPEMRLGLLFSGVSPAGGASNVWTCILDGNLDLSVTMTTLSTLAAFGMMPLWLFTLGPHIFADAELAVPYNHIAYLAIALILPLGVGWLIQRFLPRLSHILVRILKGFSALLILFIVIFAIATNLYLFRLATWQICLSGLLLPWCGYVLGAVLALLFRLPSRDVMAIAIETGVQNTGIAIFWLRFILPQPQADLTTVVPVAIAVMTPVPLSLMYFYRRCCRNNKDSLDFLETDELSSIR